MKCLVGKCSVSELPFKGLSMRELASRDDSSPTDISLTGQFPTIKQCPSSVLRNGKVMYQAQQGKTHPTLCSNQSNFPEHRFSTSDYFLTNFIFILLVEHSSFVVCSIHLLNITRSPWPFLEMEYFLLSKLLLHLTIASNFMSFHAIIIRIYEYTYKK